MCMQHVGICTRVYRVCHYADSRKREIERNNYFYDSVTISELFGVDSNEI